jgi:23S rRNA (cytosine1962-C5)-methyltransferase
MKTLTLKRGKETSLCRRHPWVFSGAAARVSEQPAPGETVAVLADNGDILGYGAYSADSQIRVRMWTFTEVAPDVPALIRERIASAVAFRRTMLSADTNAFRAVHAESDGVPGLIVDLYGTVAVCQFLTAGAEANKETIIAALCEILAPSCIYDRSDVEVRTKEGLPQTSGVLFGALPQGPVAIQEFGCTFLVDVTKGHKTGFYLDQRDNRKLVGSLAKDKTLLNCFSYTGGFGLSALHRGAAHITNVDTSAPSLAWGKSAIEVNGFDASRVEDINGDVFKVLRDMKTAERTFDCIVLDPPKFADSANDVRHAGRGYKDINMCAIPLVKKDGLLFTFSCSGNISDELFQMIVFQAALDAQREVQIIGRMGAGLDHPVSVYFPEGRYLKGLILRVR